MDLPCLQEVLGLRRCKLRSSITSNFLWNTKCRKHQSEVGDQTLGPCAVLFSTEDYWPVGVAVNYDRIVVATMVEIVSCQ